MNPEDVLSDLKTLLTDSKVEEAADPVETAVAQHIALAGQVVGIDLDDDAALDDYLAKVKSIITKDKGHVMRVLRRWSASKSKAAVRTVKSAL